MNYQLVKILVNKVEIILEQREVAFLSPSKICEILNFSREIQIFANTDYGHPERAFFQKLETFGLGRADKLG